MAISRPIKFATGLDVGQHQLLLNLLKSFLRERPRVLQPFPAWDLLFVLLSLVKPPCVPISKTVDTQNGVPHSLPLRGEIHAKAYSTVTHALNWSNIVLLLVPGFISKTQVRTRGASSLEPVIILSLRHTLGHNLA